LVSEFCGSQKKIEAFKKKKMFCIPW